MAHGVGRWALGVGREALGVRRWALGVGRWALGVGRWAWIIFRRFDLCVELSLESRAGRGAETGAGGEAKAILNKAISLS